MADTRLLYLINEGIEVWNNWRKSNTNEIWPDLTGADFANTDLSNANLRGAKLNGSKFESAKLRETILHGAKIKDSTFFKAYLRIADLRTADLSFSDFSEAILKGANLSGTNLTDVDFSGADLRSANFSHSTIKNTCFSKARIGNTIFGDVNLSTAKDLDDVNHAGPSVISVNTLLLSDNIPNIFLRGIGLPENIIEAMKNHIIKGSEYNSCFISYSSLDQEFVEKLHSNLQDKGIRCWVAPEDMNIGDKIRQSIDEAIRKNDKLLFVISENSINSPWVEKEVETAFEEERKNKTTILFPIRLDDKIMETAYAWAADIRRTRHIGDFRKWKDNGVYDKAFNRLVRDLSIKVLIT